MPGSTSTVSYLDVKEIFDRAMHKGVRMSFPRVSQAEHWVQRAHFFRRLERRKNRIEGLENSPTYNTSPYDVLRISRVENVVTIETWNLQDVKVEEID